VEALPTLLLGAFGSGNVPLPVTRKINRLTPLHCQRRRAAHLIDRHSRHGGALP
jgi:hypothetical protein